MSDVRVFELNILVDTMKSMNSIHRNIDELCNDGVRKAEDILHQTQEEQNISEMMLNAARAEEAIKLAKQLEADARMAKAIADEASAAASMNPIAIAAASAEVAAATAELAQATEEYHKAVQHRERLEHRFELAQKCVNIAQEMLETLKMRFSYSQTVIDEKIAEGNSRIQQAYDDLSKYLARLTPTVRAEVEKFYNYEPEENRPVTPKEVHDRLNASKSVINSILEYLYCTDIKFHGSVDRLCEQLKIPGNETVVEVKIKKNIVGRLCEELVIRCFSSMGGHVETQGIYYLEDGSYTKADMILYDLKEPLILGRGPGMGAQKGGNLGIEVKSGYKEYIFAQLGHMGKQAKGHSKCDISCTVCTRDITDLPNEKEELLRTTLKNAGSPILGMLPYKAELDNECIQFVKCKMEEKNVRTTKE